MRLERIVREERGLTLIEVMLASFLAITVVLGIASFQASIGKYFRQGSERLRLQQNVHRTSQVIAIGVRRAHRCEVYDPADPGTPLLQGPAVRLKDGNDQTIDGYRRSDDGLSIVDGSGRALDDMRVADLWFESAGPDEPVVVRLSLLDRYGHQSEIRTEIAPRN